MKKREKGSSIKKFFYAFRGLYVSTKEELSLMIHFIAAFIAIIIGIILRDKMSLTEWVLIILVIGMVIIVELLNTAIESLCDMVSFKFNFSAKKIKDISAAATLISAIVAIIVGGIIYIPKLIELFQGK